MTETTITTVVVIVVVVVVVVVRMDIDFIFIGKISALPRNELRGRYPLLRFGSSSRVGTVGLRRARVVGCMRNRSQYIRQGTLGVEEQVSARSRRSGRDIGHAMEPCVPSRR